MGHKPYQLPPYQCLSVTGISSSQTSVPTNIFNKDVAGIDVAWTGTLAGTFTVQCSNTYNPNGAPGNGNWNTVPTTPSVIASTGGGNGFIQVSALAAAWLQLVFTYTSGSGDITATITGKGF